MKFSELRDNLAKQLAPPANPAEYQLQYLNSDHRQNIDAIRDKCIYHLFEDLTTFKSTQDFELFLGQIFYRNSNDYAVDCAELAFHAKHIYGKKIKHWTDSALKCFDNFLIKYINDVLQEKIIKCSKDPKERDVYTHLINKGGTEYEVGIAFESIYLARNEFTHVQVEVSDGRREPVIWTNKKYNKKKELILFQFSNGLKNLEVILSRLNLKAQA